MKMPDPPNPFIRKGELKDKKIADALRKAAGDYENGEIIEVMDVLYDILDAMTEFCEREERLNGDV